MSCSKIFSHFLTGSDVSETIMLPPGSRTPAYRSVHSSDSVVRKAVDDMPDAVDRIWNLRSGLLPLD